MQPPDLQGKQTVKVRTTVGLLTAFSGGGLIGAQNAATSRNALPHWEGSAVPIYSFIQSGAFDAEGIAAMSAALEAACDEHGDAGRSEVVREIFAQRIIAAAKLGERDPVRLREAALRRRD